MVAAINGTTSNNSNPRSSKTAQNPTRPRRPLLPSEKDNGVSAAKPKIKQVSSRYLSSASSSSPISSPSPVSSRRFPSPLITRNPETSSTPNNRAQSVDRHRRRSSTPRPIASVPEPKVLRTSTRSLAVSFQCESFSIPVSKTKSVPPNSSSYRPDRRRAVMKIDGRDHLENSKPVEQHRWPGRTRESNPLARSVDCANEKKEPVLQLDSINVDSPEFSGNGSGMTGDLTVSSDTESVSSGSNSGVWELRGIARGWAAARLLQEPSLPLSKTGLRKSTPSKKTVLDNNGRLSSPLRGPVRNPLPSKLLGPSTCSPSRVMSSPLRVRGTPTMSSVSNNSCSSNTPSILSFACDVVRRGKLGENRIEDAHLLRLFYNRNMQWRFVNARAGAALRVQRLTAEKNLHNAWVTTSALRNSVTVKRIKLQLLTRNLKLACILKGQMAFLEEWALLDRDHSSSLSGAFEALKASTLRLPIVGGARADIQKVEDAVVSAVDVMQAMGSSICSTLEKVEGMNSLVAELANVAAQERALLGQCKYLLSRIAAMQAADYSLRTHLLQLKHVPSLS